MVIIDYFNSITFSISSVSAVFICTKYTPVGTENPFSSFPFQDTTDT